MWRNDSEYWNSEEQIFWEGHYINFQTEAAAKNYAATWGRDIGFCSACNCWVDRDAHFDRDLQCILTCDRRMPSERAVQIGGDAI